MHRLLTVAPLVAGLLLAAAGCSNTTSSSAAKPPADVKGKAGAEKADRTVTPAQ